VLGNLVLGARFLPNSARGLNLTAGARISSCVKASYVLVNHAILALHAALLLASTRTTLDAVGRDPLSGVVEHP
jgi:hypothetical protein